MSCQALEPSFLNVRMGQHISGECGLRLRAIKSGFCLLRIYRSRQGPFQTYSFTVVRVCMWSHNGCNARVPCRETVDCTTLNLCNVTAHKVNMSCTNQKNSTSATMLTLLWDVRDVVPGIESCDVPVVSIGHACGFHNRTKVYSAMNQTYSQQTTLWQL